MAHEFEDLEDAVLSALEPLQVKGLKTLEPYADQLEAEELEQVTLRFPCIYVVVGPLRISERNRYDDKRSTVTLLVGDRNIRGSEAATRGDVSSPGVYELLILARAALHRQKVHSGWSPLSCTGEEVLAYAPKKGLCIYVATYETKSVSN